MTKRHGFIFLQHRLQGAASPGRMQAGQGLVEIGFLVPVLVIMLVGLVDFGRILMMQHVVTNAAREGVREAVLPDAETSSVKQVIRTYLQGGGLDASKATITVTGTNATTGQPATVTVTYNVKSMTLEMFTSDSESITLRSTSGMPHE